ncbi:MULTISPECIES: peptidase domain-containing ABC transporter [Cupriavidus]
MSSTDSVRTGFGRRLSIILQTEATECGLACLAMVASYHGLHQDLRTLRQQFPTSLKGANLSQLMKVTERLAMASRAVRVDLEELGQLRLPCILHWNFNHFVVLKEVSASKAVIHDPAQGPRVLSLEEVSAQFTGVAMEVWPSLDFQPSDPLPRLQLRTLLGRVTGLHWALVQLLCLALALEIFGLITPLSMQWITDHVLINSDRKLLTTLILGFSIVFAIQQGISAMRAWCMMHLGATLGIQWKANVFSHLLRLPTQYFERRHIGDIVSRFGSVDAIHQTLTNSILTAALDGLVSLVTLGLMLSYSAKLALIPVCAMVVYCAGRALTYKAFRLASQEYLVKAAKTQSHFLETVRGIRAIQIFQKQDERRSSWVTLMVNQVNASLKSQRMQLVYQQANGVLFGFEGLVVLYLGATLVIDGDFTIGMLIAFNSYKGQFNSRVGGLIDNYFSMKLLQLQGERLADIVLQPAELTSQRAENDERSFSGEITVRNIQYRYAHGEPTVLAGVDFHVHAGEAVSIVGPTGCGKTTLLNILLGTLKPTRGEVLLDGIEMSEVGASAFRRFVATVMQDDTLFAGSIADNICFFENGMDQEKIVRCATVAGIHDEIAAMPMGYNTLVGDMGSVLSGGQKQRILLARALHKEPVLLILDEATCHLNAEKEQEILSAIRALKITRITVAHRAETILSADRIIALSNGRVGWIGTPAEFSILEDA